MSLDQRKPVEAKRTENTLVASFHRATPPLVWRFDLERNHSFTLALQGDEGEWELGLTSPKGEFHPVARFSMREDAEEAFIKVEGLLAPAASSSRRIWRAVLCLITALIVLVVAYVGLQFISIRHRTAQLSAMGPSLASPYAPNFASPIAHTGIQTEASPTQESGPEAKPMPEIKPGEPLSADDYLKPPAQ